MRLFIFILSLLFPFLPTSAQPKHEVRAAWVTAVYGLDWPRTRATTPQTIRKQKKELTDIKYDALTRSSELMEKSRQSRIEEYISSKESDLQTSTNPPYLIK